MKKKVLVVDLDGTLYSINTFHYFIKFLINYSIKNFEVFLLVKILVVSMIRGFQFTSHSKLKYVILKAIANKTLIDYKKFVNSISLHKRYIPLLKEKSFDIKILATAAPSCYATIIAKNNSFDLCLGTDFPSENYNNAFENCKEIKKKNVLNHLSNDNIHEIDTFVTDHIDDLPLLKLASRNIIIKPNNSLKAKLKKHSISFEILS